MFLLEVIYLFSVSDSRIMDVTSAFRILKEPPTEFILKITRYLLQISLWRTSIGVKEHLGGLSSMKMAI